MDCFFFRFLPGTNAGRSLQNSSKNVCPLKRNKKSKKNQTKIFREKKNLPLQKRSPRDRGLLPGLFTEFFYLSFFLFTRTESSENAGPTSPPTGEIERERRTGEAELLFFFSFFSFHSHSENNTKRLGGFFFFEPHSWWCPPLLFFFVSLVKEKKIELQRRTVWLRRSGGRRFRLGFV